MLSVLFSLFLFNNLWCLTLLSPLSYPGEMSLAPASSVKLASLTERSAKRPCSDWHGIPWLCRVRLQLLSSPLHIISILKSGKISTPSKTPTAAVLLLLSFVLFSWSLSVASASQRSLFVDFFSPLPVLCVFFWRGKANTFNFLVLDTKTCNLCEASTQF